MQNSGGYVAPRNAEEEKLCELWGQLLNRADVGICDDFFSLGGHSLMVIQLHASIREQMGWEIDVKSLYEHSTIQSLMTFVKTQHGASPCPFVFMFSPASRSFIDFCKTLDVSHCVFSEVLDQCGACIERFNGVNIREFIYPTHEDPRSAFQIPKELLEPICFSLEYSLAKFLLAEEVLPESMIGDGVGEYVVASLAGAFTPEQALEIIVARSKLLYGDASAQAKEAELTNFKEKLICNKLGEVTTPYIAGLTATWGTADDYSSEYWVRHLRAPSLFSSSIELLLKNKERIFLELGPGDTLTKRIMFQGASVGRKVIPLTVDWVKSSLELWDLLETQGPVDEPAKLSELVN